MNAVERSKTVFQYPEQAFVVQYQNRSSGYHMFDFGQLSLTQSSFFCLNIWHDCNIMTEKYEEKMLLRNNKNKFLSLSMCVNICFYIYQMSGPLELIFISFCLAIRFFIWLVRLRYWLKKNCTWSFYPLVNKNVDILTLKNYCSTVKIANLNVFKYGNFYVFGKGKPKLHKCTDRASVYSKKKYFTIWLLQLVSS